MGTEGRSQRPVGPPSGIDEAIQGTYDEPPALASLVIAVGGKRRIEKSVPRPLEYCHRSLPPRGPETPSLAKVSGVGSLSSRPPISSAGHPSSSRTSIGGEGRFSVRLFS